MALLLEGRNVLAVLKEYITLFDIILASRHDKNWLGVHISVLQKCPRREMAQDNKATNLRSEWVELAHSLNYLCSKYYNHFFNTKLLSYCLLCINLSQCQTVGKVYARPGRPFSKPLRKLLCLRATR